MVTELKRMQQRRDTAANWAADNPVLLAGELGLDVDAMLFRVGNGTTPWLDLPPIDFTDAATLIADQLPDPVTEIGGALLEVTDPVVIDVNRRRWPDLNLLGTADNSAAMAEVLDDVPAYSRLRWHGDLRLDNLLLAPASKFLTWDLEDARIIRNFGSPSTVAAIRCTGSIGTAINISSITTVNVAVENRTFTVGRLVLDSAPPGTWVKGARVKVVSDDIVPTGRYSVAETTNLPRRGEFATILAVSGTTVDLTQTLDDTYTTSPRVGLLAPGSMTTIGGRFDVTDAMISGKLNGGAIRFTMLTDPKMYHPTILREVGPGIAAMSCDGYTLDEPDIHYLMNDTDTGIVGYGMLDVGSMFGVIRNPKSKDARHGFTDVMSTATAGSANLHTFGRTMYPQIVGADMDATGTPGLDTHHGSKGIGFHDCRVHVSRGAGFGGITLRGEGHRVVDCTVYGGSYGVYVFNDTTGGGAPYQAESYEHQVVNLRTFDTACPIQADVHMTGHANVGVRDTHTNLVVDGLYAQGADKVVIANNSNVRIRNAYVESAAAVTGNMLNFINAKGDVEVEVNGTLIATATATPIFLHTDTADVRAKVSLNHSAAYATAVNNASVVVAESSTQKLDLDFSFEKPWLTSSNPFTILSTIPATVKWRIRHDPADANTERSSHAYLLANAAVATDDTVARLFRSPEDTLYMDLSIDATARSLGKFVRGKFRGQRLVVYVLAATGVLTIQHGSTYLRTLSGAADITPTTGKIIPFVWTGSTWLQTSAVYP